MRDALGEILQIATNLKDPWFMLTHTTHFNWPLRQNLSLFCSQCTDITAIRSLHWTLAQRPRQRINGPEGKKVWYNIYNKVWSECQSSGYNVVYEFGKIVWLYCSFNLKEDIVVCTGHRMVQTRNINVGKGSGKWSWMSKMNLMLQWMLWFHGWDDRRRRKKLGYKREKQGKELIK